VRRKDEVWRRQEKQTHSEVAEETMEGRNDPLSDWKAIVGEGGVAVLMCSCVPVFLLVEHGVALALGKGGARRRIAPTLTLLFAT